MPDPSLLPGLPKVSAWPFPSPISTMSPWSRTSELEYGADDAFLLYPTEPDADPNEPVRLVSLSHQKSRDGETQDVVLKCHCRFQAFESAGPWTTTAKGRPLRLPDV
jgi:hypothetical protein